MTFEEFIELIERTIYPFSLNDHRRSDAANLIHRYSANLLRECVEIGAERYLSYDSSGFPTKASAEDFLNKLGGIAYNKSKTPIEQEFQHIKAMGKKVYSYWNDVASNEILDDYVLALKQVGWTEIRIQKDLQEEVLRLINRSSNWTEWSSILRGWTNDIKHWKDEDSETIEQSGTIIPTTITDELPKPIQSLAWQINASYENHLFDCCAVAMRRLLEVLLVLSFQNFGIETEIMDTSGSRHISLDKIIKNAEQNATLALSSNTRKGMALYKDLGNYSAHKIWYNCTQQDIQPHTLNYRAIVEELIYKAGFK